MNFFMDVTGVITNSIPVNVNQGGDDAYSVNLYTPFTPGAVVTASFRLPNGEIKSLYALTYKGVATDVKVNGADVYQWTLTLPGDITRYYGTVTMQFFVTLSNRTLASTSTSFVVGRGVPQVIEDSSPLDTILENIAALQSDLDNGYFAARAIRPWNELYTYGAGEIVWYPDIGEHGAFVESLVSNNTEPPYVDNEINSEYWEEEINFNNITDEFYDQIRALVDEAQTAAESAAESAEQAAQVIDDIGSLADRMVQIVTEVPDAAYADPDVIYAVLQNADNNLFELYALINGEMKDLGGANFVSNGTEVTVATLAANAWVDNAQTVNVNNASADKHISVSAVDAYSAYVIENGVMASSMSDGTVAFTCTRIPDDDILVVIVLDTTNIVPSLADYYTMPQVDSLIETEKNARIAADTTLQQNINTEAATRAAADTNLQQAISNEAQLRQNADTALGGRIDDVVDGTTPVAKATNATNDGAGNNIVNTYATKEQLEDYYTKNETDDLLDLKQNVTDSSLETTAKTIVSAINEVNTAVEGLREDVVNTAHFKGFAANPTAVQQISGDTNDYCYCISTGTIWTYGANGWTDSGTPYPSDATPLSNTTPIMDGTASAGSSTSAARGDHVHPTDTSRASVAALQSEASTRAAADTTLQNNIDTEASARQAADTTLQNNIDAEETARIAADATKVDKVTSTADNPRAYVAESNGTQDVIEIDTAATANTIVRRFANGCIDAATPVNDTNVAPKGYVDSSDTALGGRIDDVIDGTTPVAKATDATNATNATNDGAGNNIINTYATKAVATQTTDGLMSAEDKVALDTLADTVDFDTVVRYTEQSGVTAEQQTQAQENIGLPAQSAISRYNLGAFDTYVDNGDGTATITRATYYLKIDGTTQFNIESGQTNRIRAVYGADTGIPQVIDQSKTTSDVVGYIRSSQGKCVSSVQTWLGEVSSNAVSYDIGAEDLYIHITYNFMGQTLNTVEAAQEYFGAHPLYIQLKLATPYTEDVISERPINTLDQQAMWDVREEWEKGLNVADIYFGKTTQYLGAYLIGNPVFTPGETYTISLKTKNTGAIFYFAEDISSTPYIQTVINANGNPFTLTFTVKDTYVFNSANGNQLIKNAVDNSATNAAGDSLYDIMIVKGGVGYPYQPYHGGIIREDSTRLLRRTFIENNTSGGTMWHRVGSLPLSAIPSDYDSYGAIFLISSIYNENFGASAGGSSSVIEFDVRKSSGNITNAPVSILSGNIPTNTLCSVITSSSVDLYIAVADLNNCKQITILSEATERKTDENIFVFNTNNDFSASAPSGAVYAVNRNTSSLEANGGTVNGDINVTGTVSEQGQRVYSPNNPPPYCPTSPGDDTYLWESNGGNSAPSWKQQKIRWINGDAERGKNIYAPTGAGNVGNLLVSGGYGVAPEWRECTVTGNRTIYRATNTIDDVFEQDTAYSSFTTVTDYGIDLPTDDSSIRVGGFYIPTGQANQDYIYRFGPPANMKYISLQASWYRVNSSGNASLSGSVTPNLSCFAEQSGSYFGYVGVDWENFTGGGIYVQYVAVPR